MPYRHREARGCGMDESKIGNPKSKIAKRYTRLRRPFRRRLITLRRGANPKSAIQNPKSNYPIQASLGTSLGNGPSSGKRRSSRRLLSGRKQCTHRFGQGSCTGTIVFCMPCSGQTSSNSITSMRTTGASLCEYPESASRGAAPRMCPHKVDRSWRISTAKCDYFVKIPSQ